MRFTANFLRSEFSCPGNLRQHVTPDIVAEIKWLRSPTVVQKNINLRREKHSDSKEKSIENMGDKGLTARSGEFEGSEADVVQSLVVKNHTFICIFHELVDRQSSIVRLHNCVRNLRRGKHRESHHHPIWVLFTDLGNQKSPHSRSGTTSQRVAYLEP